MRYRVASFFAALVIATAAWGQAPAPPAPVPPPTAGQAPADPLTPDQVAQQLCGMTRGTALSAALARAEADAAAIIAQNLRTIRERDRRIADLEAEVAKLKAPPKP